MKRFIAAAVLIVICIAFAGMLAEGYVVNYQPRVSSQSTLRLNTEGSIVATNTAGDFYEASRLGEVFCIKTASAGTSFSTAGVSPLAGAGVAWLALYNPACSGANCFNLEVINSTIVGVSGTPGVGAQVYDLGCGQNITATANATPLGMLNPLQAGVGLGFTQTALTGSTALKEIRIHPYSPFAGAMAATSPGLSQVDVVNGAIVVAPGCALAIQPTAGGTTHVAAGSLCYRQAIP